MSESRIDFGVLILRLILGIQFFMHGLSKIFIQIELFTRGSESVNIVNIVMLCCAIFELVGGICLLFGILRIPICILLGFLLFVNFFLQSEVFSVWSQFIGVFLTLVALMIMGFGRFNLASYFFSFFKKSKVSVKGIVKRILRKKGFGFIVDVDGNEIFFHQTALINSSLEFIKEGQVVFFDIKHTPKGPNAVNINIKK